MKTGRYYFWEHENYIAEANRIKEEPLPEWFFQTTAEKEEADKYLKSITDSKNTSFSFSYFLYDSYSNFINNNTWNIQECSWMNDYKTYLKSVEPKADWMTNMENTVDGFVNGLVEECKQYCKQYVIERPSGGGKRPYCLTVEDIESHDTTDSIEKRIVFLTHISFLENNKDGNVRVGLNCQLFANENHRHGYSPSAKLKFKKDEEDEYQKLRNAIRDSIEESQQLTENGWEVHNGDFSPKNLQVCAKTFKCEGNPAECKEIKEAVLMLLDSVKEERNNIKSGKYNLQNNKLQ